MTGRELHWKAEDFDAVVRLEEKGGRGILHLGDKSVPFVVHDPHWIEVDGRNVRCYVHRNRNEFTVWMEGRTYRLTRVQKGAAAVEGAAAGGSGEVRAMMPGKVLRIDVAVGDIVKEKQSIVIMESMKMESALPASRAGTVKSITCQPGQVVDMGTLLVTIE